MCLQPYTLAFHHALELDDFLKEADITTTDLFAVLSHEKYRKPLMGGIRAVVSDYKGQGRAPPPVNFMPTVKAKQSHLAAPAQPATLPDPLPVLANGGDDEHGIALSRNEAASRPTRTGHPDRSTALPDPASSVPKASMASVPAPSLEGKHHHEERAGTAPAVAPQSRTQSARPVPHHHPTSMEFVPGTSIRLRHLTAPQTWTYLEIPSSTVVGMSFIARVCRHNVTKQNEKVVELDFGNGDVAAMHVSQAAPASLLDTTTGSPYAPGAFVHITNITRLVRHGHFYLSFGRNSSIEPLVHVTQDTMAAVNAQRNRDRKRKPKQDDLMEAFVRSPFVAELDRRRREGFTASR